MNTPAIHPPPNPDRKSDPPTVKIARGHDATYQNIGLGLMFTAAYLCRPDFPTDWYIGAMLAGFGVVNLPALFGRRAGSIGGLTLALAGGKYVAHAAALYFTRHSGPWIAAMLALTIGCATLGKVVRSIDVIARDLCEIWASEQPRDKLGLSPADYCAIAENVRPFADAALAAKHAGGATAAARLAR